MKRYSWLIPIVISLLSLLASGFVAYSHEREQTNTNLAVIDARQQDDRARLDRIEQKIDAILRKLKDW